MNYRFLTDTEPRIWSQVGILLWRTSAVLTAVLLLQLPASGNVFNNQDAVFLNPIVQDLLEAGRDINRMQSETADQGRSYECSHTMQESIEQVEGAFSELRNLVLISIEMIDPADERAVNESISIQVPFASDFLNSSRLSVNNAMGHCASTATLVMRGTNTLKLFDRVEAAIARIDSRLI
jgi:hypothetical protein